MPVDEPPTGVLPPKYAGHAERYRDELFAPANLDPPAFHLDNAG